MNDLSKDVSDTKLDVHEILRMLPHRFPFLMVDKVLDFEAFESITAIKNVSISEPCFTGHFPERPVMPGVLIIEALAQAAGILAFKSCNADRHSAIYYLGCVDDARFKRVVLPGDQLKLSVKVLRYKLTTWKVQAEASVDGELACSAVITCLKRSIDD